MHKIEKEVLCAVLPEFFEAREYIELAYLFGSTAEGKEGPFSDIDIGIYLSAKLTKEERIEKRLELLGEVSTLLNTNNLDRKYQSAADKIFRKLNFYAVLHRLPEINRSQK
jgi:uncharacterized protein